MKRIIPIITLLLLISPGVFSQIVTTKERCYLLTDKYGVAKLFEIALTNAVIGTIPANKELQVLETDTIHYMLVKVQYKKKTGWIHKDMLVDKRFFVNPRIRDEFKNFVENRQIIVGMNKDEVIESWGLPQKKNTTMTQNNISEQWVYTIDKYVYLDNSIVSAVQF